MSKYNTDLDYVILDIDISREELEEIKAEADKIISENKKKKDEESNKILAWAYLKKAQCRRKLESGTTCGFIFYEDIGLGIFIKKEKKQINKLLKKSLKLSPDMPEALMQLGLLNDLSWFNDKYYKSISFFNMAIQQKPDYAAAYNNRAILFRNLDDFIDKDDKDKLEKNKIIFKNAVADLTEAIKIRPFDALYHLNRGIFHSKLEEHKEAAEDFSNAINYASDVLKEKLKSEVKIFNLRGKEYTELKDFGKAIDDFSESLCFFQEYKEKHLKNLDKYELDNKDQVYRETLLMRTKAYYLAGEKDKARADMEEYLNLKQKDEDTANYNEIKKIVGITPEEII